MKYLKLISINLLTFFVLLLLGEIAIRILFPNFYLYKRTHPGDFPDRAFDRSQTVVSWPKKDSTLGWVCNQGQFLKFSDKFYNQFPIEYAINKEGFRNKIDFDSLRTMEDKKIMLLGDSFIMSVYLNENETIVHHLQAQLPDSFEVVNLGIPGYGIDQAILSYEKFESIIEPEIVVLFYIDDDIQRVLEAYRTIEGMNKPSYDIVNDTLKLRTKNNKSTLARFFERSHLLNRFYKRYMESYGIQISEKLLDRLIQSTKTKNQRLIIIRCPFFQSLLTGESFEFYSFKGFMSERNVEYYELFDYMKNLSHDFIKKLFLENDGHPSKEGAKYLADFLKNKTLEVSPLISR